MSLNLLSKSMLHVLLQATENEENKLKNLYVNLSYDTFVAGSEQPDEQEPEASSS
jgi:hypothetical protein